MLKDLITYFRDVQKSYESRAKATMSAGNVINNTQVLPQFLTSGGLGDAIYILRDFNKQSVTEGNKAKDIENEIILQLTGLRSDLQQKIKEIKSLSGDFKSSVGKEQEGTKRAVREFQEALGVVDNDATSSSSKGDPFIVKMGVDRQVARQIEEENYLHRVSSCFGCLARTELTDLGISESRIFWPRARINCCWRDPKSLHGICRHSQARGRRAVRVLREIACRSIGNGQGPRVGFVRSSQRPNGGPESACEIG